MTDLLHPGPHPDPESLNAFIEGVLPEHERLECVLHLAQCGRCREIVFLAQPPPPLPAIVPVKQRWYFQLRPLTAALAACVLIVTIFVYRRLPPPSIVPTARVEYSVPVPKPGPPATSPAPAPTSNAAPTPRIPTVKAKAKLKPPAPPATPPIQIDATTRSQIPLNAQKATSSLATPASPGVATSASSAEIKGSVTDVSGAPIAGATITVRALSDAAHATTTSDSSGQFSIAGLPAGRYEVQIDSSGFTRNSSQVELKPSNTAMLASTLSVGSMAQTVEITAAAPLIRTEAQIIRSETLSGKRHFASAVSNGTRMVAIDAAGALYFSHNQGKHWKTIKPKWHGKVAKIDVVSAGTAPVFELTTDSGALWSSPDGTHWRLQKN